MHQRPYEKLITWQEAHKLCLSTYTVTKFFPKDERFRLVNQMCKSAYGVPMNIAEGNMRRTVKGKAYFFEIAMGSLEELHYQYKLAKDLGYISQEIFIAANDQINKTSYLLTQLRSSIFKSSDSSDSSVSSESFDSLTAQQ
jgi:four helix bundle protein